MLLNFENMKFNYAALCFSAVVILFGSCASGRNAAPIKIGITHLAQYSLNRDRPVTDTTYKVVTTEGEFNNFFSAPAGSARPSFNGQTAIAIMLKEASTLRFGKAEFIGPTINVYAESCNPGTAPDCRQGTLFLATIPKAGNAKRVQFFINGSSRHTISL